MQTFSISKRVVCIVATLFEDNTYLPAIQTNFIFVRQWSYDHKHTAR